MREHRLLADERGITFVELMVAMAISAVVGSLLIAALSMVTGVDSFTREDSQALGELRTAAERFQKEMRQARKVYADSTSTSAHFWVDYNRDNQQNLEEKLIWRQETVSGETRLVRTSEAGGSIIQAVDLVTGSMFVYDPAPEATTVVTITLTVDVSPGSAPSGRTVRTQVRLRNATQ
jgi:type II secretory pathway pseudopilin PulG